LEKGMTKEKSQGDDFSAMGKQTMARAYSAMDYYFDHLKKTIASAPTGGTEFVFGVELELKKPPPDLTGLAK
jgi:hypothetical protein